MKEKIKHLSHLSGLGIYIVLGTASCAAYVAGVGLAFDDFVFQLNIPRAYLLAAFAGGIVCYALYLSHAEDIKNSVDYLWEYHPVVGLISAVVVSAFLSLSVFHAPTKKQNSANLPPSAMTNPPSAPNAAAPAIEVPVIVSENPSTVTPRSPQSLPKPTENDVYALALLPYSLGGDQRLVRPNYPPADVCELNGAFSDEAYRACLKDIYKNPNRPGMGGGDALTKKPKRNSPPPPLNIKPQHRK